MAPSFGENLDKILSVYQKTRPGASPWDLLIAITSERFRVPTLLLAERKVAGGPAPVYLYQFNYQSDFLGGLFKAGHGVEIAFVFNHVDEVPLTGSDPARHELAAVMSRAWSAFADNGDPNHPGLPRWEPFTLEKRHTMIFDLPCRLEIDPYREERELWAGL